MSRPTGRWIARAAIPLAVLAGAAVIAWILIAAETEPERTEARERGAIVEVTEVERGTHRLDVHGQGVVTPARELVLRPQVSGKVVWVHPTLRPGGALRAGDTVLRIDPRDYQLAVRDARAQLAQARSQLAIERGRQEVAQREWALFEEDSASGATDPALALREPQLEAARIAVDAAQARLERAELELERTTIQAPFDAVIDTETVELGDTVGPQTSLATLIGADVAWVRASLPADKLPLLDVPAAAGGAPTRGSAALIRYDAGDALAVRHGRVIEIQARLDELGRMAKVLIEVEDPFAWERSGALADEGDEPGPDEPRAEAHPIPLLLDAYVDVAIVGPVREGLIEVPRDALHEGNQVYVLDDGRLAIREVDIVWQLPGSVLIEAGLDAGAEVVVSPIARPIEGMKLRRAAEREARGAPADGTRRAEAGSDRPGDREAAPR